jgi:OmpA-OmpF porin, OOP family
MRLAPVVMIAALALAPAASRAQAPWDVAKKAAGKASVGKLEGQINKKLLDESRKNQCSFKTDSDELEPGCDPKARRLADAVVSAKKKLEQSGVHSFKFEVSGHTDSSGSASHNEELSKRRAERMKKELARKGVAEGDVIAVGMGSKRPLVKPDDTAAKKKKNRRYEVQVRL